jgi:hypothetical protein
LFSIPQKWLKKRRKSYIDLYSQEGEIIDLNAIAWWRKHISLRKNITKK